jgi:hypothetical protein
MSGSIGSKARQGPGNVIMMITRRKSRVVPKNGRLLKRLLEGRVETVGACIGGFDKNALDVRHKPKAHPIEVLRTKHASVPANKHKLPLLLLISLQPIQNII